MKQRKWKGKIAALSLSLVCAACVGTGAFALADASAATSENYTLSYDTDLIKTAHGGTYADDMGKSGLRVTTVRSGNSADGADFAFENEFSGTFEMDFRVQSAQTYAHSGSGGWTHYITGGKTKYGLSDLLNPYADVQELSFTFTSKSDPSKYFTVFFRGGDMQTAFLPSAGVQVVGDEIFAADTQGEKHYGYGLTYQWDNASGVHKELAKFQTGDGNMTATYGINDTRNYENWLTPVNGTSFSNFISKNSGDSTAQPTTSNLIKFDAENMKVYINAGKGGNTYSTLNTTADVLLRDLSGNEGFGIYDKGSGELADNQRPLALGSLSATDFADGYTVSVCFADITDNATVGDSSYFGGITNYPTIIDTPYERYADMTIYSINGEALTADNVSTQTYNRRYSISQKDLFTYNSTNVTIEENVALSGENALQAYTEKGLVVKAKKSGKEAIGTSFGFKDEMVGEFSTTFRVVSEKSYSYSKLATSESWSTHYATTDHYGEAYSDSFNPYQDLKEVGFTFTSVSDPTKKFTVYIYGGATTGVAYATSARVQIDGETVGQSDDNGVMRYGYGLRVKEGVLTHGDVRDNTPLYGTSFSQFNTNTNKDALGERKTIPSGLRFDPLTMRVYATAASDSERQGGEDVLVRDLTDNSYVTWYEGKEWQFRTLSKEDFVSGYTVSVQFTDVTANGFTADSASGCGWFEEGGYDPLTQAYDRVPKMVFYSINGQNLEYFSLKNGVTVAGKIKDEVAPQVMPSETVAMIDTPLNITPVCYDVFSKNNVSVGTVAVSQNGEAYQTVQPTDGKYLYAADEYGSLNVRYSGFADESRNAATYVITIPIEDRIAPTMEFVDGLVNEYDYTNGTDTKPVIVTDDIVITNPIEGVKTYKIVIRTVLPSGNETYTTKFPYYAAGDYTVIYEVTDNFGNFGTIERVIKVGDFTAPVVTAPESVESKLGDKVTLAPTEIEDVSDVTTKVTVYKGEEKVYDGDEFVAKEAGEYRVVYTVTDAYGNVTETESVLTVVGESVEKGLDTFEILSIVFFAISALGIVCGAVWLVVVKRGKDDE